jgi:hypothetical protein
LFFHNTVRILKRNLGTQKIKDAQKDTSRKTLIGVIAFVAADVRLITNPQLRVVRWM